MRSNLTRRGDLPGGDVDAMSVAGAPVGVDAVGDSSVVVGLGMVSILLVLLVGLILIV